MDKTRCEWCLKPEIYTIYHDTEWGVPVYDDRKLFEFLLLESAQAGLSWLTILKRREGYRRCFAGFDPEVVAKFTEEDQARLMGDTGIIRNRLKIKSAVNNARIFLEVAAKHGSFSNYMWNFVDGKPIVNQWKTLSEIPACTPLAEKMAKEFKKLGFTFLGKTVLYAHMQATGLVNDHIVSCFRYNEVQN
ncbi:MAG: DNA-3-methyladenine glycosylase I [Deferribacteraceae bacterium]|jgi:DNA-3-methyladenine glycosylase I|nr:DNA-3-methyladenine glycosylase I [Deferribacteraceae bacterium]